LFELAALEVHACRTSEQAAVGVRDTRVESVLPRDTLVECREEPSELVRTRPVRARDELFEELCETVGRELPRVLREETPDGLEKEVAENRGSASGRCFSCS
jgi:hypothetical protein